MPTAPAQVSVARVALFTLIGAAIGFEIQHYLERAHRDKQLAAYEKYLERLETSKRK
jgi:hypothetical protein